MHPGVIALLCSSVESLEMNVSSPAVAAKRSCAARRDACVQRVGRWRGAGAHESPQEDQGKMPCTRNSRRPRGQARSRLRAQGGPSQSVQPLSSPATLPRSQRRASS